MFAGTPPRLGATLAFDNPGPKVQRIGGVTARLEDIGHEYPVRVFGLLPATGQARLRTQIVVDRGLPPGVYPAVITGPHGQYRAELHVFIRRAILATPSPILLCGAEGDEVHATLFLENRGNVPAAVHENALVFFEEVDWTGRSLVFAMREASPEEGHQAYLDRVFKELRSTMVHKTRVAIEAAAETLHPGESHQVKLSMTLPAGLHKGRNYAAFLDIAGTRIRLDLACDGTQISKTRRAR